MLCPISGECGKSCFLINIANSNAPLRKEGDQGLSEQYLRIFGTITQSYCAPLDVFLTEGGCATVDVDNQTGARINIVEEAAF